jgi:hypothetical protein
MTRRPVSDERSVVGPAGKRAEGERFYLKELASFLRANGGDVAEFLRSRHLLRTVELGTGRKALRWTSARGVALAVAHFRAILGRKYEQGQDVLRDLDRAKEAGRK